ncbi:hypothetical protein C8R43DRAFT_1152408 [Mycena crocata]|nr:hypothetical protein C8R43DRAFT_1152408 [Mycena crocata]
MPKRDQIFGPEFGYAKRKTNPRGKSITTRITPYVPPPLLHPALFARARGRVGAVFGVALLQFAASMVWNFWVQLYYQVYIGYSPVRTVVRLTPMFVTALVCNVVVALIVGVALLIIAIFILSFAAGSIIAPLLFALIRPSAAYWAFGFPAAVCSVVGADFLFSVGMLFVPNAVGEVEQSLARDGVMDSGRPSVPRRRSCIVFNHMQQDAKRTSADALGSYHAAMWTWVAFGGDAPRARHKFRGAGTIGKDTTSLLDLQLRRRLRMEVGTTSRWWGTNHRLFMHRQIFLALLLELDRRRVCREIRYWHSPLLVRAFGLNAVRRPCSFQTSVCAGLSTFNVNAGQAQGIGHQTVLPPQDVAHPVHADVWELFPAFADIIRHRRRRRRAAICGIAISSGCSCRRVD